MQSAVDAAGVKVDVAELVVNDPASGDRSCWHHIERLLVSSSRFGEVAREFLNRTLGCPRIQEAFIGDQTKLGNAPAATEHVVQGVQIEALAIPAFRLVKVTQ